MLKNLAKLDQTEMDKSQRDPGKRQHDLFHAKGVMSFRFMPIHRNNMPVNGVGSGFQRIGQWNNQLLLVLLITLRR